MDEDPETSWPRQLVLGLIALVAVALVIGGVVSAFALGAARFGGVDSSTGQQSASPSLVMPTGSPTTKTQVRPGPTGSSSKPSKKSKKSEKKSKTKPKITLSASPTTVAPSERINLSGKYPGGAGTQLQVQRFAAGSWERFPVTVTVKGGTYRTYILTSRTGKTRFRVLDTGSGRASNPVTVTVG